MSEQGNAIIARGSADRAKVMARFERNLAIIAGVALLGIVGSMLIQPVALIVIVPVCFLAMCANFEANYEALDKIHERVMRELD